MARRDSVDLLPGEAEIKRHGIRSDLARLCFRGGPGPAGAQRSTKRCHADTKGRQQEVSRQPSPELSPVRSTARHHWVRQVVDTDHRCLAEQMISGQGPSGQTRLLPRRPVTREQRRHVRHTSGGVEGASVPRTDGRESPTLEAWIPILVSTPTVWLRSNRHGGRGC